MSSGAQDPSREILKATKAGDVARVEALLAADDQLVHASDADGAMPLHFAAWKGKPEIVALLIDKGADLHLQSRNGHWGGTPLHAAAHANQRAVAELLISRGADIHRVSGNGRTPLMETALHNATAVANLLKKHGAAG